LTALEDRLFRAYLRRFGKEADRPSSDIEFIEENGRTYARLSNCNGILAVYRVKDDSSLKFIKAQHFYED
jgi:hypothetical protein